MHRHFIVPESRRCSSLIKIPADEFYPRKCTPAVVLSLVRTRFCVVAPGTDRLLLIRSPASSRGRDTSYGRKKKKKKKNKTRWQFRFPKRTTRRLKLHGILSQFYSTALGLFTRETPLLQGTAEIRVSVGTNYRLTMNSPEFYNEFTAINFIWQGFAVTSLYTIYEES